VSDNYSGLAVAHEVATASARWGPCPSTAIG